MHVLMHYIRTRMKSYSANVGGRKECTRHFLMQFVLEGGLWIANWRIDSSLAHDSWTCCRCFDDAQVQIDFIFADKKYRFGTTWCDFAVARLSGLRCSRASVFRRICLKLDNSKL